MTAPDPVQAELLRRRYLADQVETASPGQRLLMLFDALVRDFTGVRAAFADGSIEQINDRLLHAQEILFALRDPLDTSTDLGRALSAIYSFCLDKLIEANLTKKVAHLDEVQPLIEQIATANRTALATAIAPVAVVA